MEDCIFCKIANKEINSEILFECDEFFLIKDIKPVAKLHYLAIPKQHYARFEDAKDGLESLRKIFETIPTLKQKLGLDDGYRIIINQGKNARQAVQHVHVHILGGQDLGEKIVAETQN